MSEYNIVSVSGGKDSTALLLLALERQPENLQAVFADTGHEHPLTYEYVAYLHDKVFPIRTIRADFSADLARRAAFVAKKWREQGLPEERVLRAIELLKPTGNPFLDLCVWKGLFPSTKRRFCSEELKRNPIIEQVQMPLLDAGHSIISWQGIRADESAARAHLPERDLVASTPNGAELWNYRPILQWTVEDVFAMHAKHGIDPNPLYKMGMGRVGCMPCIHARKDELLEIGRRFPEEIARVAEWERMVSDASRRGLSSFFPYDRTPGEHHQHKDQKMPDVWQVIEWAKTSRGGTQYDMFRADTSGPLCSSLYGLCE